MKQTSRKKSATGRGPASLSKEGGYARAAAGFEDGVARICRLYGVSALLGRLYAVLFLATEPLGLDALCERVGAAKSTVSVALRQLLSLRLVSRLPPRADRRDFYQATTDPWALIADWSRIYFRPELEMWRSTGSELTTALAGAADAPRGEERQVLAERIDRLRGFMDLFEQLLADLSREHEAPKPAQKIPIRLGDEGYPR